MREHMSIVLKPPPGPPLRHLRGPVRRHPRPAGARRHLHRDARTFTRAPARSDTGRSASRPSTCAWPTSPPDSTARAWLDCAVHPSRGSTCKKPPFASTPRAAAQPAAPQAAERWSVEAIEALFELPFPELMFRAQTVHRENFDPTDVQLSTLLSIKTGGCPEDCAYCPQAARYDTGVEASKLMGAEDVLDAARAAQAAGATPLLHGRRLAQPEGPRHREGRRTDRRGEEPRPGNLRDAGHARRRPGRALSDAGLDYYNHNLDTAPGVLRRHHRHAPVRGSPRHAEQGAQRRRQGLLRRHRGHGRDAHAARRAGRRSWPTSTRTPSRCPSTTWCRSKARRCTARTSSTRSSSCAPSPWRASPMPKARVRLSAGRQQLGEAIAGHVLHGRRQLHLLRRQAARPPATRPSTADRNLLEQTRDDHVMSGATHFPAQTGHAAPPARDAGRRRTASSMLTCLRRELRPRARRTPASTRILIGDSLGMVIQGDTSTVPTHARGDGVPRALRRRAANTQRLGRSATCPFGAYQESPSRRPCAAPPC